MMDAGARGLIVPMVNSIEDVEKAVAAVYYPGKGTRGVGLARAQGYGAGFHENLNWLENEAVIIVQIESINAVKTYVLGVGWVEVSSLII